MTKDIVKIKEITYEHYDLESVDIEVTIDNPKGIKITEITINLPDGTFDEYVFKKEI